ncbi:MAG: class I SAM-dependent methyltransferase [Candidatus Omnitrophota bacterium]
MNKSVSRQITACALILCLIITPPAACADHAGRPFSLQVESLFAAKQPIDFFRNIVRLYAPVLLDLVTPPGQIDQAFFCSLAEKKMLRISETLALYVDFENKVWNVHGGVWEILCVVLTRQSGKEDLWYFAFSVGPDKDIREITFVLHDARFLRKGIDRLTRLFGESALSSGEGRIAFLTTLGIYDGAGIRRLTNLFGKFSYYGSECLSIYEKAEVWSYLVLLGLHPTGASEALYGSLAETCRPVIIDEDGTESRVHEVNDLYIGYDWESEFSPVPVGQKDALAVMAGIDSLPRGATVLCVGCDNGDTLIKIAAKRPHLRFIGLDANPCNLGRAVSRIVQMARKGIRPANVELRLADCRPAMDGVPQRGIPLADNSVDMVMVIEGAMDDETYQSATTSGVWTEILRTIKKPGGALVFVGRYGDDEFHDVVSARTDIGTEYVYSKHQFHPSPWQDRNIPESRRLHMIPWIKAFACRIITPSAPVRAGPPAGPDGVILANKPEPPADPELPLFESVSRRDGPQMAGSERKSPADDAGPALPANILDPEQLSRDLEDSIMSMLFSPLYGQGRIFLGFSENLGKGDRDVSSQVNMTIDEIEKWRLRKIRQNPGWENMLRRLVVFRFKNRHEFLRVIKTYGITVENGVVQGGKQDECIFTFAPGSDRGGLHSLGDPVRQVFVNENNKFHSGFYYPIFEIVTMSIVKELTGARVDELLMQLASAGVNREQMADLLNIESIEPGFKTDFLVFNILPHCRAYDNASRVNRNTILRRLLMSA